jgi:ferredoxin
MSQIISQTALRGLAEAWLHEGKQVVAPVRVKAELIAYQSLHDAAELLLDGFVRPANSVKDAVFPRHEVLFHYRVDGRSTELTPVEPPAAEQIVLAARPCDAAALAILDHVFNWDVRDAAYNRRRERTTVVTLACTQHDAQCFCTSVGGGPDDPRGSDAMLFDLGEGQYEVRPLTEKGRALFATATQPSERTGHVGPGPAAQIDLPAINEFLAGPFDRPEWAAWSLCCLGCGACAYTCPTCHCFDIVDEGGPAAGARVRNWDACQFGYFTQHASGHNPRNAQPQRQRQRILHKFQIYPQKFGPLLCTGCGNCTRNCPAGLGVLPVLQAAQAVQTAREGK